MPAERIRVDVDGQAIWLTHPDGMRFDSGYTKAEVVDYYVAVAEVLLPHLAGRPLAMSRFPDGPAGGFFAENAPTGTPSGVRRVILTTSDGDIEHLVVESRAALAWLASMSVIELHIPPWTVRPDDRPTGGERFAGPAGGERFASPAGGERFASPAGGERFASPAGGERFASPAGGERFAGPADHDRLVIALDPGSGAGIAECAMLALALREALTEVGLDAVAKTNGTTGMHLLVPVAQTPVHEAVGFVRGLAETLATAAPDLATTRISERERSGRVLLDWRQNAFPATTVAPYSLRAGHSPGVSTPITWDEVAAAAAGMELAFDRNTVRDRILTQGDLASPLLLDERPPLPPTAG